MKRRSGALARKPARENGVKIEIVARSRRWERQPRAAAIVKRAIAAAARAASTPPAELAIVLTNDSAIRALNRDWRGRDAPTNVLSFPAPRHSAVHPRASGDPGSRAAAPGSRSPLRQSKAASGSRRRAHGSERKRDRVLFHLGDIVIAFETLDRESNAEGKPFGHHLAHLAIHGYLHLIGHDHETARDARRMERLERKILAELAIPDPYTTRAGRW